MDDVIPHLLSIPGMFLCTSPDKYYFINDINKLSNKQGSKIKLTGSRHSESVIKLGHIGLHNFAGPGIPGKYVNEGKGEIGATGGTETVAATTAVAPSA